ncbi:MAG: hypothetical protein H6643_11155 [Caldilineaceae bacterium]|nr:hypothetical protein [Caldilineaceae bacterium]
MRAVLADSRQQVAPQGVRSGAATAYRQSPSTADDVEVELMVERSGRPARRRRPDRRRDWWPQRGRLVELIAAGDRPLYATETDLNGLFCFDGIALGTHRMVVSTESAAPRSRPGDRLMPGELTRSWQCNWLTWLAAEALASLKRIVAAARECGQYALCVTDDRRGTRRRLRTCRPGLHFARTHWCTGASRAVWLVGGAPGWALVGRISPALKLPWKKGRRWQALVSWFCWRSGLGLTVRCRSRR